MKWTPNGTQRCTSEGEHAPRQGGHTELYWHNIFYYTHSVVGHFHHGEYQHKKSSGTEQFQVTRLRYLLPIWVFKVSVRNQRLLPKCKRARNWFFSLEPQNSKETLLGMFGECLQPTQNVPCWSRWLSARREQQAVLPQPQDTVPSWRAAHRALLPGLSWASSTSAAENSHWRLETLPSAVRGAWTVEIKRAGVGHFWRAVKAEINQHALPVLSLSQNLTACPRSPRSRKRRERSEKGNTSSRMRSPRREKHKKTDKSEKYKCWFGLDS